MSDVRRVVNAEADDEDDGDAGDGVDGETPEVDDANDVDQGEGDTGQHHQANLGGGIQLQRVPSRIKQNQLKGLNINNPALIRFCPRLVDE